MIDKYASSLQKGANGNARNVESDEIAGRIGAVALAASNVLLALAVDKVRDTDDDCCG
jgi:acetylglutamate kinase